VVKKLASLFFGDRGSRWGHEPLVEDCNDDDGSEEPAEAFFDAVETQPEAGARQVAIVRPEPPIPPRRDPLFEPIPPPRRRRQAAQGQVRNPFDI